VAVVERSLPTLLMAEPSHAAMDPYPAYVWDDQQETPLKVLQSPDEGFLEIRSLNRCRTAPR